MAISDPQETSAVLSNDRPVQAYSRMLLGILLILSAFALDFAREFLLPVTMAFFIALTFRPIIRKASKKGVPAWLSATVFMVSLIGLGATLIFAMSAPVAMFIAEAPQYSQIFITRLHIVSDWLKPVTTFFGQITASGRPVDLNAPSVGVLTSASPSLMNYAFQSAGYSIDIVTTLVLTAVTAAFMMASGDLFYEKLVRVLPTLSDKKHALDRKSVV